MTETEAMFACRPNLLVRDLTAGVDFYVRKLGFAVGWWWSEPAGRFVEPGGTDPGTALLGRDRVQILLTQKAGDYRTWLHFDVHTAEQVDALHAEWAGRGVVVAEAPAMRAWGNYEMRLSDVDGNVLRVSSPPRGING